jgi:hypothetical protein
MGVDVDKGVEELTSTCEQILLLVYLTWTNLSGAREDDDSRLSAFNGLDSIR